MKRLLPILLIGLSFIARSQSPGDPALFFKGSGLLDSKSYVTKVNSSLYSINGSGVFTLLAQSNFANASHVHTASAITDFNTVGDARWSLLGHVHTFASLTSRPTTVAGYGITDFNSLGDARWSLLGHTHVSANITDGSTGGNGTTDGGKVVKFNAAGGLSAYSDTPGTVAINAQSDAGIAIQAYSGPGIALVAAAGDIDPAGKFIAGTGNVCAFENGSGPVLNVTNSGALQWFGSGAATTRTNLGLGSAATTASTDYATAAHTHTFASLTSKPTTVGGYGITDFNSLGDARWSLLGHTHAYSSLTGIPSTFAPSAHTHPTTDITGLGTLATQSGTFSGTSSGTNTGDQYTSTTASRLIGRGSAAGAGAAQEITLGIGLSMSGATLSATNTGTVTSVSVNTANGVSGTVDNATTTPAITLSLGAITPTSVAATGTVTGSNLSGTNTGNQTITLTGDVTGSGTGSFAATLATVNSTTGSFGSSTAIPSFTVNGKGLITAASTNAVVAPAGTLTGSALASGVTASSLTSAAGGTFGTAAYVSTGTGSSNVPTIAQADARYMAIAKQAKVSNFTFNSATYTNLTGAAVTLDASTTYQVKAIVTYTCPTSATGIGLSVTMTGSPTARNFNRAQPVASTGTVVAQIPTDDAGSIATGSTGTTELFAMLEGNVLTSGSTSTLQLRVARGGTSATVTILSATIIATPIP
jgi:hypothetical protein